MADLIVVIIRDSSGKNGFPVKNIFSKKPLPQ